MELSYTLPTLASSVRPSNVAESVRPVNVINIGTGASSRERGRDKDHIVVGAPRAE